MVAKTSNRNTNESNVFVDDLSGNVAKNVVIGGGELKLIGMNTAMLITNMSVPDTPTALPPTSLSNRNSLIIYNKGSQSIFIGPANVEASGSLEGWEIDAGSYFSVDITDDVAIYAISPTGKTANVKLMEMA